MPRIMEEYACWSGQLFVCCEASILACSHPLDPMTVFVFLVKAVETKIAEMQGMFPQITTCGV